MLSDKGSEGAGLRIDKGCYQSVFVCCEVVVVVDMLYKTEVGVGVSELGSCPW